MSLWFYFCWTSVKTEFDHRHNSPRLLRLSPARGAPSRCHGTGRHVGFVPHCSRCVNKFSNIDTSFSVFARRGPVCDLGHLVLAPSSLSDSRPNRRHLFLFLLYDLVDRRKPWFTVSIWDRDILIFREISWYPWDRGREIVSIYFKKLMLPTVGNCEDNFQPWRATNTDIKVSQRKDILLPSEKVCDILGIAATWWLVFIFWNWFCRGELWR